MDELLRQVTLPDGIGAGIGGTLLTIAGYLLRRVITLEREQRSANQMHKDIASSLSDLSFSVKSILLRLQAAMQIQQLEIRDDLNPRERQLQGSHILNGALEEISEYRARRERERERERERGGDGG